MGIGAAPAMCRLVLAVSEYMALQARRSSEWACTWLGGIRYVDDARILALCPATMTEEEADAAIREFAFSAWPAEMIWKPDMISPMVGVHLFWSDQTMRWLPVPKSLDAMGNAKSSGNDRLLKSMQDGWTFAPEAVVKGTLLSQWHRCWQQSSDTSAFRPAVSLFTITLVKVHRHEEGLIRRSIRDWCQSTGKTHLLRWIMEAVNYALDNGRPVQTDAGLSDASTWQHDKVTWKKDP